MIVWVSEDRTETQQLPLDARAVVSVLLQPRDWVLD